MEIREIHNDAGPAAEVKPGERFAIKLPKRFAGQINYINW